MDEGIAHASINSQLVQIIAMSTRKSIVRLLAPQRHLEALKLDSALAAQPNVTMGEIPLISTCRRQVNVASWERFRQEFAILRSAIATVPSGEPCLVVLASAAPTAVYASLLAGWCLGRNVQVQMVLHGFANEVEGWRSRNPIVRRLDLRGLMEHPPAELRFLVLERSIAAELAQIVPASADSIDVLPLPVNTDEVDMAAPVPLGLPLRVALVGQTTAPKGISPFLETARAFKARYGEAIEFHVVGRRFPETDPAALSVLARPIPDDFMTRAEFRERLAPIHYIFLPLHPSYYRLSASGALIDAITWLKPVIASDIPICADAFADGGDIGYLCRDLSAMHDALHGVMQRLDNWRYMLQVGALRALRDRRMPAALVDTYTHIIETRFAAPIVDRHVSNID
jgi:hypothetical protein